MSKIVLDVFGRVSGLVVELAISVRWILIGPFPGFGGTGAVFDGELDWLVGICWFGEVAGEILTVNFWTIC